MKCAIYTRVSTDNQAEKEFNSCEAQEAKIKSFIKSQEDMEVFKVYTDAGFTGANTNRPALGQMLLDIQDNKIDLVISYKIDRLTRSPRDFYGLIELFDKHDVDFFSVTERFDTSTPSGRLLRNIMLTFAQFERELTSERTKDKLFERAQKGLWNGGSVPFGYRAENKKLLINKKEAKIVSMLFDSYISSRSLAGAYDDLKNAGVTDRKGMPFSKSTIFFILRSPLYIGMIRYHDKVFQGVHEPIISEMIFNTAQTVHKEKPFRMRLYKQFSLAGIIKCKNCDSFMTPCYTNKNNKDKMKRYYYYRCTKTLKRDWADCNTKQVSADRRESYVFETIERISQDTHYLDSLIFKLNNAPSGVRAGFKPPESCFESTKISPEIFAQTLQQFVKNLPDKKGIEKNLWAKKFINRIVYSPAEIALSLYYKREFDGTAPDVVASGRVGATACLIPDSRKEKTPTGCEGFFEVAGMLGLEPRMDAPEASVLPITPHPNCIVKS